MKFVVLAIVSIGSMIYLHNQIELQSRQAYQLGLKIGYITRHYQGTKQDLESLMNLDLVQATNRLNALIHDNQRDTKPAN